MQPVFCNPEKILISILNLCFVGYQRMTPEPHRKLTRSISKFFERQIEFFGNQPMCYPIVDNLNPVSIVVNRLIREEYLASRRALFTAWLNDPIQWDIRLLKRAFPGDGVSWSSAVKQIFELWDNAFLTEPRLPALKLATIHLAALAVQHGFEDKERHDLEKHHDPFTFLSNSIPPEPELQIKLFELIERRYRHFLENFKGLQRSATNGIDWVVGIRPFVLRCTYNLVLLRVLLIQPMTDQLKDRIRQVEDALNERCADLTQIILAWVPAVAYIFHRVRNSPIRDRQMDIDYWYSRGHIPDFTRDALSQTTIDLEHDFIRVPPIYKEALNMAGELVAQNPITGMFDNMEDMEQFILRLVADSSTNYRGATYLYDDLFPADQNPDSPS